MKFRQIDAARKPGYNTAAILFETIYTIPADIGPLNLRWLRKRLGSPLVGVWQPALGADDQEDAYRSNPNAAHQLPFSVIAIRHPDWKGRGSQMFFAIAHAALYGFSACMPNYNRTPELLVAVSRRLAAVPCWHFFDDVGTISLHCEAESGQQFLGFLFDLVGVPVTPSKHVALATKQVYLGVVNNYERTWEDVVTLDPKDGRVDKILAKISTFVSDDCFGPDGAVSLRGDISFLACSSYHRVLKGGLHALLRVQRRGCAGPVDEVTLAFFVYLRKVLLCLSPVNIWLEAKCQQHAVVYTDAFFEPDEQAPLSRPPHLRVRGGIGALIISPKGLMYGFYAPVPSEFWTSLLARETQVFPAEVVAISAVLHSARSLIEDSFVLLFTDSLAGACAWAKGSSSQEDVQHILTATHLALYKCRVKWWIEWIEGQCNPADSLSRGRGSPWVDTVHELIIPPWAFPTGKLVDALGMI